MAADKAFREMGSPKGGRMKRAERGLFHGKLTKAGNNRSHSLRALVVFLCGESLSGLPESLVEGKPSQRKAVGAWCLVRLANGAASAVVV